MQDEGIKPNKTTEESPERRVFHRLKNNESKLPELAWQSSIENKQIVLPQNIRTRTRTHLEHPSYNLNGVYD